MEEHKDMAAQGSTGHPTAAAVRYERRSLLIHSMVLAVAIPALLWCAGGDTLLAGWSLSLFLVTHLFLCTCLFSNAAMPLGKIFVALSYAGLFAFLVGSLLSNVLGMVIVYLISVVASGLFGGTLAKHRQSSGTETAALVAATNNWAINRKPEERESRQDGVYFIIGFMALCCAPRLVWLLVAGSPLTDVAVNMFMVIGFLELIHISCVLAWLNNTCDDTSLAVMLYFAIVAFLSFCSYLLMGETVGITLYWLCILASTAFLGYYHQVYASYEEILSNSSSEPPATEGPQLEEILVV